MKTVWVLGRNMIYDMTIKTGDKKRIEKYLKIIGDNTSINIDEVEYRIVSVETKREFINSPTIATFGLMEIIYHKVIK